MEFTKEQITFIMQCIINACELFSDEYDAIEEELEKYEKKDLTDEQFSVILNVSNEREEKEMTRKEMMDEVIKTRGMEDEKTIWFCELCEDSSLRDETLFLAFIAAVTCPIDTEE